MQFSETTSNLFMAPLFGGEILEILTAEISSTSCSSAFSTFRRAITPKPSGTHSSIEYAKLKIIPIPHSFPSSSCLTFSPYEVSSGRAGCQKASNFGVLSKIARFGTLSGSHSSPKSSNINPESSTLTILSPSFTSISSSA